MRMSLVTIAVAIMLVAAVMIIVSRDESPASVTDIAVRPAVIPAAGGPGRVSLRVRDDIPFPTSVTVELFASGDPRRSPPIAAQTRTALAGRGRLNFAFDLAASDQPEGRHRAWCPQIAAVDFANHKTEVGGMPLLIAGPRSTVHESLASATPETTVARIDVWDMAVGRLDREYLVRGEFVDRSWARSSRGNDAALLGDLETLLVVKTNTPGKGFTLWDLQRGVRYRFPSAPSDDQLFPEEISADHKTVVVREAGYPSRGRLFRYALNDVNAAPQELEPSVPARPVESARCPPVAEGSRQRRCVSGDEILEYRSEVESDPWHRVFRSGGYYGAGEARPDAVHSAISADGSTAVFIRHYETYPGPNWVQVVEVNTGKVLKAFTYRPCSDTRSRETWSCDAYDGYSDRSFANRVALSFSGQWLLLGKAVFKAPSWELVGLLDTPTDERFAVALTKGGTTQTIEDPELWAAFLWSESGFIPTYSVDRKVLAKRTFIDNTGNRSVVTRFTVYNLVKQSRQTANVLGGQFGGYAISGDAKRLHVLSHLGPLCR